MDPKALALQFKDVLTGAGYQVGPDGTVRQSGAAIPPWSWAQSVPALQAQKVNVQGSMMSPYTLTPGFPESAWHGMAQSNGPFTNPASWDQTTGTYDTSTDWGTLLGTAGVGALFAAPAIAALAGGGGGAAGAEAGAQSGVMSGLPGAMNSLPAAASAPVYTTSSLSGLAGTPIATAEPSAAPMASGAGPLASGETGMGATQAAMNGAPASIANVTSPLLGGNIGNLVKALTALGATLGGHAIASAAGTNNVPPQLNDLLNMAVQRQQQQQPIAQAVDQGMYSMLPNFAKTGTSMPNVPASPAAGMNALFGGK